MASEIPGSPRGLQCGVTICFQAKGLSEKPGRPQRKVASVDLTKRSRRLEGPFQDVARPFTSLLQALYWLKAFQRPFQRPFVYYCVSHILAMMDSLELLRPYV